MSVPSEQAKAIFLEATEGHASEDWPAFLDRACGGDIELRAAVEKLLRARAELGTFHEAAERPLGTTIDAPAPERPGNVIGPYKLLEQIGEGGMGDVWMAEQSEPIQRRVAIKVIKAGMDSKQVLARFEAERQALALMDHPNIAKVLDAGATATGRPYFVMELVKGTPITRFCDEKKLNVRERLDLFGDVCRAVQHAHQKGIIHRDIKPSNVLVAPYDGRPVVKVIDFGVAKATGQKLTEATLFTGFGAVVGTPEYMSPEQAEVNNQDIDTRSDIYCLGVLLYELLTGSTPLTRKRVKDAAFLEVLRVIREEEPPKPSTRLSSTEELPSISAQRHTEPAKLTKLVRGELDWIVMKALEKDRARRYDTANGLAMDVQRYLADETVQACPPSVGYRLKKFVRRNRLQVIAAGLVLATLLAGLVGSSLGFLEARRQAGLARAEAEKTEEARAEEARQRGMADAEKLKAEHAEASTLADYRASTDDAIEHLIGSKPELGPQERTYLEKTLKRWQAFAARQGDDERSQAIRAEGHARVAHLWMKLGRHDEARREYEATLDLRKKLADAFPAVPEYRQDLANTHNNLGVLLAGLGQRDEARREYEAARDLRKKLVDAFPAVPEYRQDLAGTHNNLGKLLAGLGQRDEARREYEAARDLRKKLADAFPAVPEYRQGLAGTHHNLGNLLAGLGKRDEARREYEAARDLRKKLADAFPAVPEFRQDLSGTHNYLGNLLAGLGKRDEARREYEAARDLQKKLADAFPAVPEYRRGLAGTHHNLGILLADLDQRDEARREFDAALDLRKKLADAFPAVLEYRQGLANTHNSLGVLLAGLGQRDEARREYEAARDLRKKLADAFPAVPEYRQNLSSTHNNLGNLLAGLGQRDEARREFEAARDLQKKLADAFPAVPEYQQDLASTHNNLGALLAGLGQRDEARREYEAGRDLRKKLADAFPAVPEYQVLLGGSYCNLGCVIFDEGQPADSLPYFDLAIRTLTPVHEKEHRDVTARRYLRNSYAGRAKAYSLLKKHAEALKDWDRAIELSPKSEQSGFRIKRAIARIHAGQVAEGVAEIAELTKTSGWAAGQWYGFACAYAVASDKITDRKQEYADRAMELLHQAVKAGWKNAAHMKTDSDLDPLREREDFKKLLAELENKKK